MVFISFTGGSALAAEDPLYFLPKQAGCAALSFVHNAVRCPGSAPVATHWGYDIIDFIFKNTGMKTVIKNQYDLHYGICGEFRDVCISKK